MFAIEDHSSSAGHGLSGHEPCFCAGETHGDTAVDGRLEQKEEKGGTGAAEGGRGIPGIVSVVMELEQYSGHGEGRV